MSEERDNSLFRFRYGELNDVTPPNGPTFRPQSGRESGLGILARTARETYRPDPFGTRREWYGQVLRIELAPDEDATENNFQGWEKIHRRFSDNPDIVRVKVRIPELHSTIPEPMALSADPESISIDDNLRIDQHPTFIAQTSGLPIPNIGDVVKVSYDRQSGQAIYLGRVAGWGVAATTIGAGSGAAAGFGAGSGASLVSYTAAQLEHCVDGSGPCQVMNADATELSINTSKVWPWRAVSSPGKTVTLVVFYHGYSTSSYGKQDWIINNSDHGVKITMTSIAKEVENTLFMFPTDHAVSWTTVAADIQKLQDDHNITIEQKILGCWSGGSTGAGYAMDSDVAWDAIILADPSPSAGFLSKWETPANEANYNAKVTMYYNKSNWNIEDFDTDTGFDTLATRMTALNNQPVVVTDNHNTILETVFKLIGQVIT